MNLTHLIHSAGRISAFVALMANVPIMVAMASPSSSGTVRMVAKPIPLIFGALPVVDKAAPANTAPKTAAAPIVKTTVPANVTAEVTPAIAKAEPATVTSKSASAPATKKAASAALRSRPYPAPVAAPVGSPSAYLVPVGESRVYRLERPVKRVAVGNPEVADYIMLNPSELYLLGKKAGATNLILWDQAGNVTTSPLQVSRGIIPLKALLRSVLPNETDIQITAWGPALVLSGSVSDALAAETAYRLVKAYLGGTVPATPPETTLAYAPSGSGSAPVPSMTGANSGTGASAASGSSSSSGSGSASGSGSGNIPGLVNLLKVRDPQQVRLEVHIAEVSRSLVESLGLGWTQNSGNTQGSLMSGFVSNATLDLLLQVHNQAIPNNLKVEAQRKNSLIKILAEPTIVAMSGQEGYFLVGGKVYTPTVSTNGAVDYVERTYGVGLRFTPTVLDGGRIALRVAPEVSEPLKDAIFAGQTTNGTLLPAFKTSYASTTVQMNEGQNLVIGGLLRDNINNVITAVPLLGDIPILGSLFRRTETNNETTELMVFVRPTLVKASDTPPELPTDRHRPASKKELFLDGKLESSRRIQ